jgi:AmmeMemoRadiSam system protein B
MIRVRKPTVSGMFYNAGETSLRNQIHDCFLSEYGPGFISEYDSKRSSLKAVIVPHAGYQFSGGVASYAYNEISASGFGDVFIILGPNHGGFGSGVAMSSEGVWLTPLGETPVDNTLIDKLKGGIIDPDDITMNNQENSIEVQLPFLQFLSKNKRFSIVPIAMLMQDKDTVREVGNLIADVIKHDKRNVVIIASTDFSHEGAAYGRIPFGNQNVNDFVYSQDKLVIDKIMDFNPDGLIDIAYENNISMCGIGPVATVLNATKNLGAKSVELLKYRTSYDIHPDTMACVGYASFVIR